MKVLVIICVMFHELAAKLVTVGNWQEEITEPEILIDRDDLLENPNLNYGSDKHSLLLERLPEQIKRIASPDDFSPQPRYVTRSLCTCETQYDIRDLGEGHYPRYLTASRCKPKPCQNKFNSCRLLHYKIHILTQRNLNDVLENHYQEDSAMPETPLPESLREKWRLKPMSIGVACVPGTDGRRN